MKKSLFYTICILLIPSLFGCYHVCGYSHSRWIRENTDSINYVKQEKDINGKKYVIVTDTVSKITIQIYRKQEKHPAL